MSDENIKKIEPSIQATDSKELTENDLESVTGGDKAAIAPANESVSFNFTKIEYNYSARKED